jgi:type II secretory ATPase GspE/PulE/Tfp pilus assembly ATPase PilB-like protein
LPPSSQKVEAILPTTTPATAEALQRGTIYEPGGCPACGGSGYRGRSGIFEALRVSERIEELIIARASAAAIRSEARKEGMRTLREAGWRKVAAGETSIAEIFEHTLSDSDPALAADPTAPRTQNAAGAPAEAAHA